MKNKKSIVLILVLGLFVGYTEYRIEQLQKRVSFVQSYAMAASGMANSAEMMVQSFYDIAPHEIVKLVAATKCNCGQDKNPSITITSSHDDSR